MRYQLVSFLLLSGALCGISQSVGSEGRLPCGRRKVKTVYLIQNGIDAKAGHWPWHAAIFHRDNGNETYVCGGSIVDENTILTSAHCVFERHRVIAQNRVSVHVGRSQLKEEGAYTQKHDVREIIVHSGFSQDSIVHDIALIKLAGNITMTKFVQPVCLWTMDNNQDAIVDKNGTMVGFGLTERDVVSNQLKQALIRVVDALTCIESDRAVIGTHLTGDMFCGRGPSGVSACNGDSGGGMFFEVEGRWFVRGVVSFISRRENTALCDGTKPTVYTDAAKYEKWIEQYVDPRVLVRDTDVLGLNYEEKLALFDFNTCGLQSAAFDAFFSSWTLPWLGLAIDLNLEDNTFDIRCTVTLLSEWYAVGPAHCFKNDGTELRLRFGGNGEVLEKRCIERNGALACTMPTQTKQIQRVIIHPKYNTTNLADNIALIELLSPVDITQPNTRPICLPVVPELRTNEITNLSVVSYLSSENSFRGVNVSHLNAAECRRIIDLLEIAVTFDDNRLCARMSEEDTKSCTPLKAGTPLQQLRTISTRERFFFRGFDIFALSCISPVPVYLDGDVYLDWILYNMKYNAVDKLAVENTAPTATIESDWAEQKQGNEKLQMFNRDTCGLTATFHSPLGATPVDPWKGVLQAMENNTISGLISESVVVLISERYALAPAHIVYNNPSWRTITLGYYDRFVEFAVTFTGLDPPYQTVQIKSITPHPEFTGIIDKHNIALIELLEPANTTKPYIRPICLPLTEQLRASKPFNLTVSSLNEKKRLREVNANTCQDRMAHEGLHLSLNATVRCAIGVESWAGAILKTGAPLQTLLRFDGLKRYFLGGLNCLPDLINYNNPNMPYLFTDVSRYLDWILANVRTKEHEASQTSSVSQLEERVNHPPVRNKSKRRLLNFNNCGEIDGLATSFRSPWSGFREITFTYLDTTSLVNCAVALISEWYAVGPARCLSNADKNDRIRLGGFDQQADCVERDGTTVCDPPTQNIPIESITIHPEYNRSSVSNDIALIRLAHAADLSRTNVKPICLPVFDEIRSYEPLSLSVLSLDVYHKNVVEMNVTDKYINPTECERRWKGLARNVEVVGSKRCVLTQSEGDCDSIAPGSPLYSVQEFNGKKKHFLRGIGVLAPNLCSLYYPVLYTDIDEHLDWILENMDDSLNSLGIMYNKTEKLILFKR